VLDVIKLMQESAAEAEEEPASLAPSSPQSVARPQPPSVARTPSQHSALQPPRFNQQQQQQQQQQGELDGLRRSSLDRSPGGGLRRASSAGASSGAALVHQPYAAKPSPESIRLAKRCNKALAVLGRLRRPGMRSGGDWKEALPPAALRTCKALVFFHQRKAGLLGGWDWGQGCLIRRHQDGTWGAPVFLKLRGGSLGLTLGLQTLQSVSVLQTDQQVKEFVRDHASLSLDATMPSAYVDPLAHDEPVVKTLKHSDVSLPPGVPEPYTARLSDGLIYDISVRAGVTYVDDALNTAVYGPSQDGEPVTPTQILAGLVDPPREFLPLFKALDELAGTANLTRRTISKYEIARALSMGKKSFAKLSSGSSRTGGKTSSGLSPSGSLCPLPGGSPTSALLDGGGGEDGGGGSLFGGNSKLFGDVNIGFEELHTYEQQEAEELAAEMEAESTAETAAEAAAQAAHLAQPAHA
jgi:lipid-binding SYLF domain-containing protein